MVKNWLELTVQAAMWRKLGNRYFLSFYIIQCLKTACRLTETGVTARIFNMV